MVQGLAAKNGVPAGNVHLGNQHHGMYGELGSVLKGLDCIPDGHHVVVLDGSLICPDFNVK